MKKLSIAVLGILTVCFAVAQPKQGIVVYERVSQMEIHFADNDQVEHQVPQSRTDQFQLIFANNQSIWKHVDQQNDYNEVPDGGGGMQIRMVVAGNDDVLFNKFDSKKSVELREFFDKKFIVDDSIRSLKWKMGSETKTILNHVCQKATAVNYTKRMSMNIDNGKMVRKEIADTANITAWFTTDIPVSAGPAEYQGQLPGLILAMDINNGRQVFKAISISDKPDLAQLKEPQGKKHYTPEEFRIERDKMMEEMEKNNGGGNRRIQMN